MERELEGKVALVTGGSRGIGRAIAVSLAENGAHVALNYFSNDEAAEEVEREIRGLDRKVMKVKCSVADYGGAESMVKSVKETLGPIDILVNNAGILRDKFLIKMEPRDWVDVIQTNLVGMINVTHLIAFSMMRRKKGKIVNMASLSGMVGVPGQTNYAASKGGVIAFTKSLSKELAPFGVNVNAVAPGYIETEMLSGIPEKTLEQYLGYVPLGRFGKPREVADTVLFLVSEKSRYLTGQVIGVDGGLF
ncbi:MAG: beta-ketoacyl-ACP reductase [Nitrospirae bacterium]|nr:beta-ketoacyl-ACP reductase [Nitrospirota bacterium]